MLWPKEFSEKYLTRFLKFSENSRLDSFFGFWGLMMSEDRVLVGTGKSDSVFRKVG